MRCVANEHPQISWRARDHSSAQPVPCATPLPAEAAAELTNWANTIAAPLLVPCDRNKAAHNPCDTVSPSSDIYLTHDLSSHDHIGLVKPPTALDAGLPDVHPVCRVAPDTPIGSSVEDWVPLADSWQHGCHMADVIG